MSDGYYNDTVSVRLTVKCPTCGIDWDCEIEALREAGEVPRNEQVCNVCGCIFEVRATMDVSVVAKQKAGVRNEESVCWRK